MSKKGKNTKIGVPPAQMAGGKQQKKVVFKVDKNHIVEESKKNKEKASS